VSLGRIGIALQYPLRFFDQTIISLGPSAVSCTFYLTLERKLNLMQLVRLCYIGKKSKFKFSYSRGTPGPCSESCFAWLYIRTLQKLTGTGRGHVIRCAVFDWPNPLLD
jgi:hypothetical protein